MADDSKDISRSIADEVGDSVFQTVQTPVEIFFLGLFTIGVLSLAATTLVGPCGNVDDVATFPDPRTIDFIPGATVVTTSAVTIDETVITDGACGIIDSVDEEEGTAHVHILAKAPPLYADTSEQYHPFDALSSISDTPLATVLFLHANTPSGDVPLTQITPVPTRQYTNWVRDFYLNGIYILMAIIAFFVIILGYIGYRFEKKRKVWYERHTLRATYISRLMQDKKRTRELGEEWERAVELLDGENPEQWQEGLTIIEEVLDGVLTLLRFEGDNLHAKLGSMEESDLWTIRRLWQAHSLVVRIQGFVPEEGSTVEHPPVTEKTIQKIKEIYAESLVYLGLLPYP